MARVRDLPAAVLAVGPWAFLKRLYAEISEDHLFTWAAAMAYSWLFAVFPFLLFLLSLIPLVPMQYKQYVFDRIHEAVTQLPREAGEQLIWPWLEPRLTPLLLDSAPGIALSFGLILTIWAASGGMAMTMSALDSCYDVPKRRPYWKQRPLAVGLTLTVVTLILAVLILIPVGTLLTDLVIEHAPQIVTTYLLLAWQFGRYGLALLLLFLALSLVYHFGANHDHKFRLLTPGSVFSVIVWIGLGALFRVYIDKYGRYGQTYGTVGGVVILLLYFYIDSLVLLIGAEMNALVDKIVRERVGRIEPDDAELLEMAGITNGDDKEHPA